MLVLFIHALWRIYFNRLSMTLNRGLSPETALLATEEDLRDRRHVVKSNERHLKIKKGLISGQRLLKDDQTWSLFVAENNAHTAPVYERFSEKTRQTSRFYSAEINREKKTEVLKKVFFSRARRL